MNTSDIQKIIEYVTQEVLKKLSLKDKEESFESKNKILAISVLDKVIFECIDKKKFSIDYLEAEFDEVDIDEYEHIFIGDLKVSDLSNIALGLSNSLISKLIIDGILKSANIYIVNEEVKYRKHKKTINSNFYNMMKNYEKKLESFGVNFISSNEISSMLALKKEIQVNVENNSEVSKEDAYCVNERIVTEALAKDIFLQGAKKIELSKNTIVTPLAKDYFKRNYVEILKR